MSPFKPKKEYTTIAIYAALTVAAAILLAVILFNFSAVSGWFSSIFSVLSPLLYGLIFAYLLRPLVKRFEKLFSKVWRVEKQQEQARRDRRSTISRVSAIILAFLCVFTAVFCFIFFLLPLLVGDSATLGKNLIDLALGSMDLINEVGANFGLAFSEADVLSFIYSSRDAIAVFVASFGTGLAVVVFDMSIGLCLSAGILYHRSALMAHVRRLCNCLFPFRVVHYLHRITDYSDRVFGKYLVGKIMECLLIGLLYLIILPIIGVPYPFLITVIMTLANFIPVIGAYIGGLPSGILILTEVFRDGSDTSIFMVLWFIIIVLVVEQIDGNIIFPKVIGSIIGLRAVWIMVAVALFGGLFGMIGMFLSAPLFSIVYMLVRDAANHRLAKKNQTDDTDHYADLFATTAPPRKRAFKHHFFFGPHEKDQNDSEKK